MPVQTSLNIVTLVMCIITLAMATTALLPQIKMGLVFLRDLVLWSVLFGFLAVVGFFGWIRLHEIRNGERETASPVLELPIVPEEAVNETETSITSIREPIPVERYLPPLDITKTSAHRLPEDVRADSSRADPQPSNRIRANRSPPSSTRRTSVRPVYRTDGNRSARSWPLRPIFYEKRYPSGAITSR